MPFRGLLHFIIWILFFRSRGPSITWVSASTPSPLPCLPLGGWTSPTDNLSYYMIWCRRSRFTDLRECTRYSPRRSVITKSYSFENFVRIHSLVGPVLQRGHPGREYAREWGAQWAGFPFSPLQAWAGRVRQVPSPHQEGVYFTTGKKILYREELLR